MVQAVFPTEDDPGYHFQYTIGLFEKGLPELVVYGLPYEVGGRLLNYLAEKSIKDGEYPAGHLIENALENDLDLLAIDVTDNNECWQARYRHEGKTVKVTQIVWPDKNNKFPWENEAETNEGQFIPENFEMSER